MLNFQHFACCVSLLLLLSVVVIRSVYVLYVCFICVYVFLVNIKTHGMRSVCMCGRLYEALLWGRRLAHP